MTRYVHEFLPGWEESTTAEDTNRIPTQITHSAGAVYSIRGPWTVDLALDLFNVTNERVFDVLGVQRPVGPPSSRQRVAWRAQDESGEHDERPN